MAGHLLALHALIRHVAVHAGHPGRSVRAVDPGFIFGMLHLDHGRLRDGMNPVRKLALEPGHRHRAVIFIHAVYLFGREALFPREMRALGRAVAGIVEIVFHMALRAHQRTHFRAGQPSRILARKLQIILERFAVELKLHVFSIVAGGAADGVVVRHLRAELVDILGPEIIPVLPDPFHHPGGLAVPAGGGQAALFPIAVDTVDFQKVVYGVGMPPRLTVFVHEGVAQPQVLEVGLGGLRVALGQTVHIVVLHEVDRALVPGHHFAFVVAAVRGILKRERILELRRAVVFGILEARLVHGSLEFRRGYVIAGGQQPKRGKYRGNTGGTGEHLSIHRPPSLY